MHHKVYIPTANVNKCNEVCAELESPDSLIGPSLAMFTGSAGRGKTEFAKQYATKSGAIYVPPMKHRPPGMILREITFRLCKMEPRTLEKCLQTIESEMETERRLIFIDEADEVGMSNLEMFRNINERYSCPIVLIGEEGLKAKLGTRRRLSSRIRRRVEFDPVKPADIVLFYENAMGLEISPQIAAIVHNEDWRPVLTTAISVERAMKASGLEEVTEELARAVMNGHNA